MRKSMTELIRNRNEEKILEIQNAPIEEVLKKKKSKNFSKEIVDVIERFESRFFSINSTEDQIYDTIENDFRWLKGKDDHYEAIQFSDNDRMKTKVTRSPKFNKWKKILEEKFEIKIDFYEVHSNFGVYRGVKVDFTYI